MSQRTRPLLIVGLLLTSVCPGLAAADPSNTTTPTDGLNPNESATLWSRDDDTYLNQSTYRRTHGGNRSLVQQYANGTDFSFKRPPDTAARWTRHDFESLDAGDQGTSLHPPHASLEDGSFIKDAHATVFSLHPSTRSHLTPNRTPLYVAPNGTVRGFVDYRIQVPTSSPESAVVWTVRDHRIERIRLKRGGKTLMTSVGSHTPTVDYRLDPHRSGRITLEADISAHVQVSTPDGVVSRNETLTVSDTVDVRLYNISASAQYAKYPNGDQGVAVFQTQPWQGYTLGSNDTRRVRGVWRFYTARDRNWERLLKTDRSGTVSTASDAIPVYVHAYPSSIGPSATPIRDGPDIIETWGNKQPSPTTTVGKNVRVSAVTGSYSPSHGVAVRESQAFNSIRIVGIVRGVNTSLNGSSPTATQQLRRSDLSVEVLRRSQSQAVLRIELRDARTGKPIVLAADNRGSAASRTGRSGYITIAGQHVETNQSGIAVVSIDRPGVFTARYHPGLWITHRPAYVSDTATVRWHPLGTANTWFALVTTAIWQSIPFLVVFCAGHRLLLMLGFRRSSGRYR